MTRHLLDAFEGTVASTPERTAFIFLSDGENETVRLDFRALHDRIRAIATWLSERAEPGDRILLVPRPGPEYVAQFLGCAWAGCIAVPAIPPRPGARAERLEALVASAAPKLALTDTELPTGTVPGGLVCFDTSAIPDDAAAPELSRRTNPEGIVFLQYTSGSTRIPRGVMVTHDNLLHNVRTIRECLDAEPGDTSVTWLPPYHDMGLIGALLTSLFTGMTTVAMPPLAFLQRPLRWLRAISRYRASHSGGPDFAYALCARSARSDSLDGLDLSSWRVAYQGAEPVRPDTLDRFVETFAPAGFRRQAFLPCYGLAEATLMVTGIDAAAPPRDVAADAEALERGTLAPAASTARRRRLVACGPARPEIEIRIVDPESHRPLPNGRIGEIWISGPSVAVGYWHDPEQTRDAFGGRLHDGSGSFLRSGDLGALIDGELVVTGRLKDLIIVDGRNHAAHDLEATVSASHPAFVPDAAAAFSVESAGSERVVVVQEIERGASTSLDVTAAVAAARAAVSREHGVALWDVVLIRLRGLPRTSSGKIRRGDCRRAYLAGSFQRLGGEPRRDATASGTPIHELEATVRALLAQRLNLSADAVDETLPLAALGLDSKNAVVLSGEIGRALGRELAPTLCYDHPTLAALCRFLSGNAEQQPSPEPARSRPSEEPIAIVGIGCRFPGARSADAFADSLQRGVDSVTASRPTTRPDASLPGPGGFLDDPTEFDRERFGILPREAEHMDPQQRIALEIAWEALEHAAIAPDSLAGGSVGVFVGISNFDYSRGREADATSGTGNALSIAANRISYVLDLRGPSVSLDTACSSSLVAVHQACRALADAECELALAGGVNLILDGTTTGVLGAAGMLSPDGRCRTFDADADGYVRGEGCGFVVLEPLSRALAHGREVLAVIRGSAVNQDGRTNGLTAPNGAAQRAVIEAAWRRAGVGADDIGYIEAHGTGTALGDPIEFNTLVGALAGRTRAPCRVGSVKANIGHLEAAAGIAGLIKAVLSIQRAEIFPHLHVVRLNPALQTGGPLAVVDGGASWPEGRRIAGVSSFGFGGTNAHVVVEAPPTRVAGATAEPVAETPAERGHVVAALSARNDALLPDLARSWADWIESKPEVSLESIAATLALGRAHEPHRRAWVVSDRASLVSALRSEAGAEASNGSVRRSLRFAGIAKRRPRVAFLFTGQGALYAGMGADLYRCNAAFRRSVDACDEVLRARTGTGVRDLLLGDGAENAAELRRPSRAQPALFCLQQALVCACAEIGLLPDAVLGHSIGELAAASCAGALDVADALELVAARGRVIEERAPRGAMAAILRAPAEVTEWIGGETGVVIAAINGERHVTVSGSPDAVYALCERAREHGAHARALDVEYGFHSPSLRPLAGALGATAARMPSRAPRARFFSTVTGSALATAPDAEYWVRQLTEPVLFERALRRLVEDVEPRVLVEIGPDAVLAPMSRGIVSRETAVLETLRKGQSDRLRWSAVIAGAFVNGVAIRWTDSFGSTPRRSGAPPSAARRQRFWIAPRAAASTRKPSTGNHPLLGQRVLVPGPAALFQATVGLETDPELFDHRAYQRVVVAGASQVSLLLGAQRALGRGLPVTIRSLSFAQGLIVEPGKPRVVQLRVDASNDATTTFRLVSYGSDAAALERDAVVHAVGELASDAEPAPDGSLLDDLAAVRARAMRELSQREFYEIAEGHNIQFGPSYRFNARVWAGDGEALGQLVVPSAVIDAGDYDLHPGLIDSSFQLAAATGVERGNEAFILFRIREYRLYRRPNPAETLWAHAVRHTPAHENVQRIGVRVIDEAGRLVAETVDMQLRRASIQGFLRALDPGSLSELFYEQLWQPWRPERATVTSKRWLLLGRDGAETRELHAALAANGHRVDCRFETPTDRVLDSWLAQDPPDAIVDARALAPPVADDISTQELVDAQEHGSLGLLALLQAVLRAGLERRIGIRVVARGAAPEAPDSRTERPPVHAPMRGLCKTFAAERPGAQLRLIDVGDGVSGAAVVAAIEDGSAEPEVALRGEAAWVPRLSRRAQDYVTDTVHLDAEGAYVISGGLGALGFEMAHWLASRGARHLVLFGRSAPDGAASERIAELERMSVRVQVLRADVGDDAALQAAWRHIERPIRGVIHAAGTLADASVAEQSRERFLAVLRPKIAGLWNLHRLTREQPLDFFLAFSSVASLFGSPGQANYAAANAFLDAFASYRGGATTSIWWGPWARIGMAARQSPAAQAAMRAAGFELVAPAVGVEAAEQVLRMGRPQVAVMALDTARVLAGRNAVPPLFERLREQVASASTAKSARRAAELIEAVRSSDPPHGRLALSNYLQRLVAEAARLELDAVDVERPLNELGLDSLMALTLQDRLDTELGVTVHITRFMEKVGIVDLADDLRAALVADMSSTTAEKTVEKAPVPVPAPEPEPPAVPRPALRVSAVVPAARNAAAAGGLDFSLFYFSRSARGSADGYHLLQEGARFADRNGLSAVWLPERHFHEFGGLYPNPSVLAASLAAITERVRLRAGSVVLPLHHPARVVEEWAVVDNLSRGRVDLSFVRGWGPNDFVLAPESFERRTEVLVEKLDQVRRLWRGEAVRFVNGRGESTPISVYPKPVQPELDVWLTCTRDDERFVEAGRLGTNVLTALLLQSSDDLARRIELYRRARREHGHDPRTGRVTLMLHTFIGRDDAEVRRAVRGPLGEYLRSSVDLWRSGSGTLETMNEREREKVIEYAFERYYVSSGLLGTPDACLATARRFRAMGVDEIACLIDFGVDDALTLDALQHVPELRAHCAADVDPDRAQAG